MLDFSKNAFFFNGALVPKESFLFAGNDRGLLNGEGLFETVLVQKKPLFLLEHLQRIEKSASQLGYPQADWKALHQKLLEITSSESARLRITVTTGLQEEGSPFSLPAGPANVLATLTPYQQNLPPKIKVKTRSHFRSEFYRHKHLSLAENCWLARQKAPYYELLLVQESNILEGIYHNFFFFRGKQLCTPTLRLPVLPGITRQFLLKLWKENFKSEVKEDYFHLKDIDECPFFCNSIVGLVPIHEIDGKATNWENPTSFFQLEKEYQILVENEISSLLGKKKNKVSPPQKNGISRL